MHSLPPASAMARNHLKIAICPLADDDDPQRRPVRLLRHNVQRCLEPARNPKAAHGLRARKSHDMKECIASECPIWFFSWNDALVMAEAIHFSEQTSPKIHVQGGSANMNTESKQTGGSTQIPPTLTLMLATKLKLLISCTKSIVSFSGTTCIQTQLHLSNRYPAPIWITGVEFTAQRKKSAPKNWWYFYTCPGKFGGHYFT